MKILGWLVIILCWSYIIGFAVYAFVFSWQNETWTRMMLLKAFWPWEVALIVAFIVSMVVWGKLENHR